MSTPNTSKPPRILKICQDRREKYTYDCVYVGKKKITLGRSGTPEAEAAFRQLQIQVLTDPTLASLKPQQITVDDLCAAYLLHAKAHNPDHFFGIKTAIKILLQHYAGQAVDTLDTRHFIHLQGMFVQHNVSRQYCNMLMGYIRAMLKWGILHKLVSSNVYVGAKFITPLKKGKTRAYEKPPRQDVPDNVINRTLPHLLPTPRDMVQVQRLASMRPSEVCRMKPCEIDMKHKTDDGTVIWMYAPGVHKSTWREKNKAKEHFRIIPLGKPEQDIIAPRLVGKSDTDYIFSPKDTVRECNDRRAAQRKSKVQPSQVKLKEQRAKKPKRKDRDCYDKDSYNRAIKRAITAANKCLPDGEQIPHWTPYQLRHAAITDIVQQTGSLDTARAVAGQKSISVTQGYNHADTKIAIDQAVKRSH